MQKNVTTYFTYIVGRGAVAQEAGGCLWNVVMTQQGPVSTGHRTCLLTWAPN